MAFKGTWHRADGGGGGGAASNDRRFPSSRDSFSSFGLPSQGVPGNQMNLGSMNYQSNPNAMYSVMNTGPAMMSSSNYSSASKSESYRGTISNLFRDYGVIDNEILFKLNTVIGPMPRVSDSVTCQMRPSEGFGTQTPYKYYGFDVRSAQASTDNRRPQRSTGGSSGGGGGSSGGPPPTSRNSDTYINRNTQNRNQPSNLKRSLPSSNNRDRHAPINNGSNNDRHRSTSSQRSHTRSDKAPPPKRVARPSMPKYTCTLPKASLDRSELNVTEVRSRYTRLHIPSDFYHASYTWHQSIPLDCPLKFVTPCSFHVFNKSLPRLSNETTSNLDPPDADYRWNVRVLLTSTPDIQSLITRSCLLNSEHGKSSSINPDDLEHPTKLIKFLVGVRYTNEYFPLGGPWSESLDGPNPATDPQVLIRTAIRCVNGQTGIDLSKCLQWCRYLEVRYHRPEEIHKGRLIESRVENIIVFLPDIAASCMPTSLEWEETTLQYQEKCAEELAEELNEAHASEEDMDARSASHHSAIDVENLRVTDLKVELKARGQPVTGLKVDLKKRLTKILHQEKSNEEKEKSETATTASTEEAPATDIKESTQADIEKLRKEIESKYQRPSHRSILVHPTNSQGDRFDCRVVSLHYLLNYANKDTIKEKSFELYLFSEAFHEMLMRDYTYQIYRALYSCLEVNETTTANETANPQTEESEATLATGENVVIPGLDTLQEGEDNEKKRKRTASQEDEESAENKKKSTTEETTESKPTTTTTTVQTRSKTIHPELLLSFTFFDRNRCGYVLEKDLEEILLFSGLSLTKNETKNLISRVSHNEKVQYHKLTDKDLPVDQLDAVDTTEQEIDSLAPKGNLLFLPENLSVFGIRSTSSPENSQPLTSVDNQRVMKQLEASNKIQTGLELKIDGLKNELYKLTDDLHSTQKSNRSLSDQLSDTKKRLRDSQHDLKESEEKYKRYSDTLYRVRSETRSTFDHLTYVLGIKEKQSTQNDSKKSKPVEEQTIKTEEQPAKTEEPETTTTTTTTTTTAAVEQ